MEVQDAIGQAYKNGYEAGYAAGEIDFAPKWIPVTVRLPEKFGEYLVVVKKETGEVYSDYADYDLFQQRWTTGLYFEIGSCVTHWMPLPEPPKGE